MATTEEVNPVRGKDQEGPGSFGVSASNGVKKLAALARIRVGDAELDKFTSEFDAILAYIGQLEKLELPQGVALQSSILAYIGQLEKLELPQGVALRSSTALRNIMREDGLPHAPGVYTEKLAEQFPARLPAPSGEGMYLEVKQIISHE